MLLYAIDRRFTCQYRVNMARPRTNGKLLTIAVPEKYHNVLKRLSTASGMNMKDTIGALVIAWNQCSPTVREQAIVSATVAEGASEAASKPLST
jgi:hypothetical protein